MNKMTAVLIDDELQSHRVLEGLLSRHHPDLEVLGSAYSVREGLDLLARLQPDLVFLDIEMPDGTGFDLLEKVGKPDFQVIFITGYDQHARTAIRFGALDYLLKPPAPEELAAALARARDKTREKYRQEQLDVMWETLRGLKESKLPSRLGISTQDGVIFKQVKDIIRLEAQQNYTSFSLAGGQRGILASTNIGEYEEQFSPYREFMRVHRSHLVNLIYVDRYLRNDGLLVLQDGSEVSVSRNNREELMERLREL